MPGWLLIALLSLSGLVAAEVAGSGDAAANTTGADAPPPASEDDALFVEDLLNGDPQARDYVDEPHCISTRTIRGTDVLDDRHVVFEVNRKKYYLVQFPRRCPDLAPNNPVFFESKSGRLCRKDSIRGARRGALLGAEFGVSPGMPCSIPGFQSTTKEQVVMLKNALKDERQAERQRRRDERKARKEAARQAKRATAG